MVQQKRLELSLGETQRVYMKVSAQIIEHLSKGIYTNPARAIKELISNAFDADATKVILRARPELDAFSITDNGLGMNYEDFSRRFLFISRSDRRDEGEYSEIHKRPIIGKFGIGFVAVSQICDEMTVISSKRGEDFKMEANIDFGKFREVEHKRRDFYELSEVKLTNYHEEKEAHYTITNLTKLTGGFREYLLDREREEADISVADLEGLTFEKIVHFIQKKANTYKSQFNLSKNLGRYWQMLWEIANTVPVTYLDDGPIKIEDREDWSPEQLEIIREIKNDVGRLNFTVDFDGVYLRKPMLFPIQEGISKREGDFDVFTFKEDFEFKDGSSLKFKGYLYNQDSSIYPPQMRGVLIRIKNTAIGGPDPDFMDYVYAEKLFQNWTFGEIYVNEGLEEAMNINRSSFSTAHPHYQKLRTYLHTLLHEKVFRRCRDRYERRQEEQMTENRRKLTALIEKRLSETLDRDIEVRWSSEKSKDPITLDRKRGILCIYPSNPLYKRLRKKERPLVQSILFLLLEAYAKSEGSAERLLSFFLKALREWDFREMRS